MNKKITDAWYKYNDACIELEKSGIATNNYVGEFAELLIQELYKAKKAPTSTKSYDLITQDNKTIQVKSRRVKKIESCSLNVIRSWDFHLLVVLLFDEDGKILKGLELDVNCAKTHAKLSKHQNGWIITTNNDFLNDINARDITSKLRNIL